MPGVCEVPIVPVVMFSLAPELRVIFGEPVMLPVVMVPVDDMANVLPVVMLPNVVFRTNGYGCSRCCCYIC